MGFKDKFNHYFQDAYFQKYGDRITSAAGTCVSIKSTVKNFLIIQKIVVELVIKPEVGKGLVKCKYKKFRWFKKPEFIPIAKGNRLMIMGLKGVKGKKDADVILLQNVLNLTTKRDLIPVDHSQIKKSRQQVGRMRY